MSYDAIFQNIFSLLSANAALVPGILGPRTVNNLRVLRSFPQMATFIANYEPQPPEGFLIIEEPATLLRMASSGFHGNHEFVEMTFHVYGTTYAITHDTLDFLDSLFHWEINQQRDIQWGERWLYFTRRFNTTDKYEKQSKLFQKDISYIMEFVREEAWADA